MKRILISLLAGLVICLIAAPAASARVPEGDLLDGLGPGQDGMIDVLSVFAHQDDESIFAGGTMLKLAKNPNVRLHILCLTLGDMSEAKDRLGITPEHLARIRVEELETAAAVYGAEQVIQLSYHDQGLESADRKKLIGEVLSIIDRTGAEIVITHDPAGVTRHPDHITCSRVTTLAFQRSDAKLLYYATLPGWMYSFVSPFGMSNDPVEPARPTIRVDISREKKMKHMVMYAHTSQKHFSSVGPLMDIIGHFGHEWFALAASKDSGQ